METPTNDVRDARDRARRSSDLASGVALFQLLVRAGRARAGAYSLAKGTERARQYAYRSMVRTNQSEHRS